MNNTALFLLITDTVFAISSSAETIGILLTDVYVVSVVAAKVSDKAEALFVQTRKAVAWRLCSDRGHVFRLQWPEIYNIEGRDMSLAFSQSK